MSTYNISSGMTDTGTVLGSGDSMLVSSGGFAHEVEVRSAGYLFVLDGGIVSGLTTDSYGHVTVSSGGLVESAYLSGGFGYRMVTLTPNGRTQIDAAPGFTPDAFIYGARALS